MSAIGANAMSAPAHIVAGLSRLGAVLRAQGWQGASAQGLTLTQSQILGYLNARGAARTGEIAAALAVSQPTASDSLAALVRKDFILRSADPADGRAALFMLTAQGQALAQACATWPDILLKVVDALDAQEQALLLHVLTKMIRTLQVQGAIPVQRLCVTCRFFRPYVHAGHRARHHCEFVGAAFGDVALRIDCGDHEPAPEAQAEAAFRRFAERASPSPGTG